MPAATIERKIAGIWSYIRFTLTNLNAFETSAVADFDLMLGEQEKLAAEQRQRLIRLERQKYQLINSYMADALPVEDLELHQTKLAVDIANARRLIADSDLEPTELKNRLKVVLALLRKARQTYDTAPDHTRQLLNTAMLSASRSTAATPDRQPMGGRLKCRSSSMLS